jgi:DNA-binding NarL/FixJ family response regulator
MDTGASPQPQTMSPPHTPISVVIARFDDLFAGGLRELIASDPNLLVVADRVEHSRIPVVLRGQRPDVAILDVGALEKLAEVRELRARHPGTRLVLLGENPPMEECAQLLAFGASACLSRSTQSRDVLNAIHLASRGLQLMPLGAPRSDGASAGASCLLTQREAEILPLLQQGSSNAKIALTLNIGVETVRTHARSIYRKLGVASRRELAPAQPQESGSPAARPPRSRAASSPLTRRRRGHGLRHG